MFLRKNGGIEKIKSHFRSFSRKKQDPLPLSIKLPSEIRQILSPHLLTYLKNIAPSIKNEGGDTNNKVS